MVFLQQPKRTYGFYIPWVKDHGEPDSTEIALFVSENAEAGTVVGILNQQLPFLQTAGGLRYQIYNLGPVQEGEVQALSHSINDTDSIFNIDPDSSVIRVADSLKLDRERLCPFASGTEKECSLIYGVSVSRRANSAPPLTPQQSWFRVKIIIQDVNDCVPKFNYDLNRGCKTVDLPEDTPVGTKVQLPHAVDLDSLQNSQLIYHLNCQNGPTNHPFALYQTRHSAPAARDGGFSQICLQLRYPLDYEKQDSYNCTLTVCDNGMSMLCSTLPLCISVHDVNDNAPVFLNANTSLVLREDIPVGSRVTTINATDADSGAFGNIRYSLVADMHDSFRTQRHFRVDPVSGDLILTSQLEGGKKFLIWVEARDGGQPESRLSRSTLSIYVVDVNNHAPKITVLPAASKVRILTNGDPSKTSVRPALSRVTRVPCNFGGIQETRLCQERGEESSLIQVFEDNIAPTNIAFIHVSDADVGENAQIDCQLQHQTEVPFGNNIKLVAEHQVSSSKIVYKLVLEIMLDCETHTYSKGRSICNSAWTISVRIACRDFGSPVRKSYHNVFVEILDNNEFPPVFENEQYVAELREGVPVGSNVLQVSVTDADSVVQVTSHSEQHNSKQFQQSHSGRTLRFELEPQSDLPFAIDQHSGRIYANGDLDAETKKEYSFKVKAINTGADNVTLTSTCQVIVNVQNINDNPPRILTPRMIVGTLATEKKGIVVQIPENLHKGTVFMQLRTLDPDGTDNSTIQLRGCLPRQPSQPSGKKQLPKSIFEVDKKTGKCWTLENLDRETESAYVCTLVAMDSETTDGLTSTATITIELLDENDNSPVWLYPRAPDDSRIQIGIDFPTSRIITRVRAVDPDSGQNARVIYSLEDASFVHFNQESTCDLRGLFNVEGASGHLRTREGIKSCVKAGDSVRLLLRATDEGTPPQSKDAEFFLEFKAGAEILNIPPESTFLTQADEAFANKPVYFDSHSRERSSQSNLATAVSKEKDTDAAGAKRIQVFVLMIAVPLAAIVFCCCLITALLFVIRSRRRGRLRGGSKGQVHSNELELLDIGNGKGGSFKQTRETKLSKGTKYLPPSKPPTPQMTQMCYEAEVRKAFSQHSLQMGSENEFIHSSAGNHIDDAVSIHSGETQMDGKLIYPIYLKPLADGPTTSTSQGNAVIRITSIPELEGTILVPISKNDTIPGAIVKSSVAYQQVPETEILMACVMPETDKSSADSGKGQSDDDIFSHDGVRRQKCFPSTSFICVPVSSTDVGHLKPQTTGPSVVSLHPTPSRLTPVPQLKQVIHPHSENNNNNSDGNSLSS
ncbi:unnamed protein product [Mesocestoides corti]|nr:unnamed protein product [Mesocestoides corti]